jgi:small subunit ribosomal protein S20
MANVTRRRHFFHAIIIQWFAFEPFCWFGRENRGGKELATHKSAIKRARQSEVRRLRNKANKTKVKKAVKQVRTAVAEKAPEEAQSSLQEAIATIDKAASKGALHKRTASRKISRLHKQVHALSVEEK